MSSRAAASRKRIINSEEKEKRPSSSSKGFFSRSKTKSSAAAPAPLNLAPSAPAIPFSQNGRHGSPQSSPYHSDIELVSADRHARRSSANADNLRDTPYHPSNTPIVTKMSSSPLGVSARGTGYPSPPIDEFQAIRLSPYHPHEDAYSGIGQPKISYIEASYQPPPPIQASYQPPPPVQTMRVNNQRSLPNLPGKNVGNVSPFKYPEPPSYPPSLTSSTVVTPLSPSTSPGPSSLSLPSTSSSRNHSPTPTLPTYSSSQLPYASSQIGRPTLQVAIHNSPLSPHVREEYAQYNDGPSYPSPPSSLSSRPGPSTMHIPVSLRPESASSSIEIEPRSWNRNAGGSHYSPGPSPPAQAGYQSPQSALLTPSPRFGPGSISGSSDSSGKSSSSPAPAGGFVFPGSRSVARPKVSKKTNSPTIKVKSKSKSSSQQGSDGEVYSPRPVPDIHSLPPPPPLQEQRTNSPVYHPSGNGRPIVMSWRDEIVVESSSSFSDDSDQPRRTNKSSDTSSNHGKPAPILKTDNSPTVYVFPGSRSRAHPSKAPSSGLSITSKRSRKTSSNTDEGDTAERSRFMGILMKKKKKKPKGPESSIGTSTISSGSEFDVESFQSPPSSAYSMHQDLPSQEVQDNIHRENRERANKIKSRIGQYPLDPYDSVLLDNDRHTGELLVRLNPTNSPSFHNYGNNPPMSVLDLGCGQGHWVVDAAIAWKGYGTKVTGYDMVDISRGLLPWAVEQGVADNIRFVRGNFLKQRLPFNDESFDLVRMSCLALCVTTDSWIFVLQEVCRVLMVGGRLELIDDLIFFPYGKVSDSLDGTSSRRNSDEISVAPRLDITIPSSSFTTFSIYDGETTNPGLGLPVDEPEVEDFYELYGVEEDEADVDDDTATINEFSANSSQRASPNPTATLRRRTLAYTGLRSPLWARARATSADLEALFEHMLLHKFGVSPDPSEFILDLLQEVFRHAQEVQTMHITLAPPEVGDEGEGSSQARQSGMLNNNGSDGFASRRFGMSHASSRRESMALAKSPGLVLWPSTFIPMDQSEIEIHASKHLRLLLSCKNYLIEHAVEATDDEEIDEASVLEALWEYEGFLRHRFNPPPSSSPSPNSDPGSDAVSVHGSIAESVCSDNREYMWELQSEFGQRFAWQRSSSSSSNRSSTPGTPKGRDHTPTTPTFTAPLSPNAPLPSPSMPSHRDTMLSATPTAPIYSREEMTHVRTFRVYEAIKMDENFFGSTM
ncbi:hypothetical protein CVT25_008524 [Psilocybe cyanescens]|uniref:Methyltransferase domain-containing protein n=1 Tax=Psilocybe cyanescens TaxID=93625 RepID=A0A409XNJ8_PSICY|nr:hypothetical protein CVT25_008524 [Psilocybe cyanescens]